MINKYKNEYLAGLHSRVWDSKLKREFQVLKKPDMYKKWSESHTNSSEQAITIDNIDRVWLCSDHHFSHHNVIKYAGRPFANVAEMDSTMVDNHNALIGADDIVIMLGDINMGTSNAANEFLDKMNGYKILIVGNHDWVRNKWGSIKHYNVDEMHVSYYIDCVDALLTHVPFISHLPYSQNFINVHGHIHQNVVGADRYINVCVEHTDYKPIKLRDCLANV